MNYTPEDLAAPRKVTVPMPANAIEVFGVIPTNEGYYDTTLKCICPKYPTIGMFIDYGGSVRAAGLTVRPGHLLASDRHGVTLIPPEIDPKNLALVAAEIDRREVQLGPPRT